MIASINTGNRQCGMGLLGLLVLLAVLSFVVLIGSRLLPVYMENFEVSSILKSLETELTGRDASRSDIRDTMNRHFQVNNIHSVMRDNVVIASVSDGTQVVIEYEVRVPLVANLDAVAHFREEALIRR